MTLEQQVTSLEISKRLKELGVKQESLFAYQEQINGGFTLMQRVGDQSYSAFTVAELGEMLPWDDISSTGKESGEWTIDASGIPLHKVITEDTEANARGKMLIYLLENKLI